MKIIGITGGAGTGKTMVLNRLKQHDGAYLIIADLVAHKIMEPGNECYRKIVEQFGIGIIKENGEIDREKLSNIVFHNKILLNRLNGIVHPLVKEEIIREIEEVKREGMASFLVIEAALLIEDGYRRICDEIWYIYTEESVRRKRLRETRNYSEEKIDSVFQNQLSDEEFKKACDRVIDNSGDFHATCLQLDKILAGLLS